MSNRIRLSDDPLNSVPAFTVSVRRFKWQLQVDEPVQIDDSEIVETQAFSDVMSRCMQQVARASYQVNARNREVFWAVYVWQRESWREICHGKSRMREGKRPSPVQNRDLPRGVLVNESDVVGLGPSGEG
jgi:hypothetical protein